MNRILFAGLMSISCLIGYAQVKFDSGYFVANDGRKTICLIKNYDWKYNPTEFLYKQTENADVQKATITDIREFGVFNFSRYERYDVETRNGLPEGPRARQSKLVRLLGGKPGQVFYKDRHRRTETADP
jgi:hypothetical protein